jgi:murein DD-endopeptidase MepM/ murein hydrolase activator NlpD
MKPHTIFFLLLTSQVLSQDNPGRVYNSSLEDGTVQVWAENHTFHPITVELDGQLSNMNYKVDLPAHFVVPPNEKKFHLADFQPKKNKSWQYRFRSKIFPGDLDLARNYDADHIYQLPFELHKGYFVSQGYYGKLSHVAENALDFDMPIGSPVFAARDGTVSKVIDMHNRSCPNESCNQYNNIIVLYHTDGSFAEYVHLQMNSAQVQPGDIVRAGQLLANSGNTGWTTGPHLHFAVYIPTSKGRQTVETKFEVGPEKITRYLRKGDRF